MKKVVDIIGRSKIWLTISGTLVALSLILLLIWGLNLGIDFTGGSLLEVSFMEQRPQMQEISDAIKELNLGGEVTVQLTEDTGFIIRFHSIEEGVHQQIVDKLKEKFDADGNNVRQERFESIGASIGQELKSKAFSAMILVLLAIVAYIAWAFRKVSYPVKSWKYGVVAIVTLFHDVIITVGIFVVLGKFLDVEVGLTFVAALLTILGYSVNDTIVVFDRIRENISRLTGTNFPEIVNRSINETISRSINTSFTTMLVLLAIFFFGGVTIKYFVLALICGIFFGTYSSIFVASPLLVLWEKFSKK